ncbi:MAG TPA: carboxypeptidase regulatory-like domain-containing protein [Pyrinomonadaceae bacterium]|nr:carboxypeptidase regulatory-like domain-containing protein [Pyrinomonadaceae bacterium]
MVRCSKTIALCSGVALLVSVLWPPNAFAEGVASGSIRGVVRATTGASGTRSILLANSRLTLVNRDLPTQVFKTVTDETGSFAFADLPAAIYILTAEADGLPTVTREISLSDGANLTVEIELTASLSESVTVRDEEGLLSTGETTTSNIVREQTLKEVPLRAENYQSALPMTPGVVRGANGDDHVKGARDGQSAYTVNGADVTDPATGKLAFDIPLEAAATVQIQENPYSAEFGRLTGGATNLDTKSGSNDFRIRAARFFPTFRYILAGPIDSFRPRVTFSGPIIRDRLFFLQSFEYRFTRVRVPSLPSPRNDFTSAAFNSFSQIDLNINKNNRARFLIAFFPQSTHHVGLNTFNPQETRPDIKQRGSLFSISEQAIFGDTSFLSSALSYKTFDVDVLPQGAQPLTLLPDRNTGNYFAETRRRTHRFQWQETYYARPLTLAGQHSFKIGAELDRTSISGRFRNNSILIRRNNGTLAQRIDFTGPSATAFRVGEVSAFAQNHWTISNKLAIDAGLRLDRDGIVRHTNLAPRVSFLFAPFKNNRTIARGGIGLFYDRMPLSVGYFDAVLSRLAGDDSEEVISQLGSTTNFTDYPQRVVTTFAPDGVSITDGPRRFRNDVEGPLRNPRSVRWSLQLDQGLTKDLTMRIGFLDRATRNELIIEPRIGPANSGTLDLSNRGRSHYREVQVLGLYHNSRWGYWNASYVWSSARGDLNTADNYLGDLPAFVIRPNEYGPLPFDVPHRFLMYGELKLPGDITFSPSLEVRSGFPFSVVNEQLDFVGSRNRAGRFPTFMSLDAQVTKGFRIPMFQKHKMRAGVAVFNITNHFNPRDVQNNLGSPGFSQFYNTLGPSVRGKFEVAF